MANGGSDCCGTCGFNQKNQGQAGYDHVLEAGADYCGIRHAKIENAFWTYCTNHPHHNPGKIDTPIGPIYAFAKDTYGREVWRPSPDSEAIRGKLLKLLEAIEEPPKNEFPEGFDLDEMVVLQLGQFREPRAAAGLARVAQFNPATSTGEPYQRTRARLVNLAKAALAQLNS